MKHKLWWNTNQQKRLTNQTCWPKKLFYNETCWEKTFWQKTFAQFVLGKKLVDQKTCGIIFVDQKLIVVQNVVETKQKITKKEINPKYFDTQIVMKQPLG